MSNTIFKRFVVPEVEFAQQRILDEYEYTEDTSALNSYESLAGFPPVNDAEETAGTPRPPPALQQLATVSENVLNKIQTHVAVQKAVDSLMSTNEHLFIRPCSLPSDDQLRIFGKPVTRTSEVFCEKGKKVLLVGRTFKRPACCDHDPPATMELERFEFVGPDGLLLFRCHVFKYTMKISIGDHPLGQFMLKDYVSTTNCEAINYGAMIVEDHNSDQVFRFEKLKRHFDVLLYPEQLAKCTVRAWWEPEEFPFLKEGLARNPIFGVPLPDDVSPRRRALLFTSSFYIYDKYYQKGKKCRFLLGSFIFLSSVLIVTFIILERMGHFSQK